MVYLNPDGFNFGPENLDGYGISLIVFGVTYSLVLYAACIYLWFQRHHPIVKMRKVGLMLLSVLVIHVFCFMVFTVYTMNGAWPCSVEYWSMNLYLPIGIGLWQAQNQQLLIVSRQQSQLITSRETYKPLLPSRRHGFGTPRYWLWRFKIWYQGISSQGRYEGFVFIGIIIQFTVSMVVYNISRKFNSYGIVSQHTGPALCRRGWEWVPSVIWQFLWNFVFGPYLLWKIRMIRDIYHWRLQTIIAVVAGLPGFPLWLAAVYTDRFASVNKYWLPGMWFLPGIMAMEIGTLAFPIYQIIKHKRAANQMYRVLADFDQKRLKTSNDTVTLHSSQMTESLNSKRNGKMYPMESLDECLSGGSDGLQIYASCVELNGENIIFLTEVITFKRQWQQVFYGAPKSISESRLARHNMFRQALNIFVTMVHSRTASYPINIESPIYNRLNTIFGPATALVATHTTSSRTASFSTTSSNVTPWDDAHPPSNHAISGIASTNEEFLSVPMRAVSRYGSKYPGQANSSSEHIISTHEQDVEEGGSLDNRIPDPLEGFKVPNEFDENVFDAAFKSIRYMVWSETWQRYMSWKQKPQRESIRRVV